MTRGTKYSRRAAVAAIASVAAAIGMLVLRVEIKARLMGRISEAWREEGDASAALAALSGYDEAHLLALRESSARFRLRLGDEATWSRAQAYLGGRWTHEGATTTGHGGYSTVVHRIQMTAPSIADWPVILDAVTVLERCPGIQVDGIELRSSGSSSRRSMDYVGMRLVVLMKGDIGGHLQ